MKILHITMTLHCKRTEAKTRLKREENLLHGVEGGGVTGKKKIPRGNFQSFWFVNNTQQLAVLYTPSTTSFCLMPCIFKGC